MHISDGIAPLSLSLAAIAVTGGAITLSLKKSTVSKVMETSLLVSGFFVASLIHVPVGFTNAHLTLNGLMGLLLGVRAFPAIFVALLLQLLLFQYGGALSLGINTITMALPAVLMWFFFGKAVRSESKGSHLAAFLAGSISIVLSSLLLAGTLIIANRGFAPGALTISVMNVPVAIVEGFITMSVVSFLKKVEPSMLQLDQEKSR